MFKGEVNAIQGPAKAAQKEGIYHRDMSAACCGVAMDFIEFYNPGMSVLYKLAHFSSMVSRQDLFEGGYEKPFLCVLGHLPHVARQGLMAATTD